MHLFSIEPCPLSPAPQFVRLRCQGANPERPRLCRRDDESPYEQSSGHTERKSDIMFSESSTTRRRTRLSGTLRVYRLALAARNQRQPGTAALDQPELLATSPLARCVYDAPKQSAGHRTAGCDACALRSRGGEVRSGRTTVLQAVRATRAFGQSE